MHQALHELTIETRGRGMVAITDAVVAWVGRQGIDTGLLTLWCRHTSASLTVGENASPAVRTDIERYLEAIAPEQPGGYLHDDEGPDDMPAHLRAMLTGVQLTIPVRDGAPMLGTWQGIFLFEHRRRPHRRAVALHLIGE